MKLILDCLEIRWVNCNVIHLRKTKMLVSFVSETVTEYLLHSKFLWKTCEQWACSWITLRKLLPPPSLLPLQKVQCSFYLCLKIFSRTWGCTKAAVAGVLFSCFTCCLDVSSRYIQILRCIFQASIGNMIDSWLRCGWNVKLYSISFVAEGSGSCKLNLACFEKSF